MLGRPLSTTLMRHTLSTPPRGAFASETRTLTRSMEFARTAARSSHPIAWSWTAEGTDQPIASVLDLNQLRRSRKECALDELCLPAGIGGASLTQLDATVRDRRTLYRGDVLYRDTEPFTALSVVRAGAMKTFVQNTRLTVTCKSSASICPGKFSASTDSPPTITSVRLKRWSAAASASCHLRNCNK